MQDNRKMMKWKPFMSLNEYQDAIDQMIEEKSKIEKPSLSEDMIEEINEILNDCYINHFKIILDIYQKGYIKKYVGYIKSCQFNIITLENDGKIIKLGLNNLLNAKKYE